MNGKLVLLVFFLTLAVSLAGQGETINGLKTGKWTNKFTDNNLRYTSSGNYKIIPLSKLDTIRQSGKHWYEVKYKGRQSLLLFQKKANGLISVQDSIWNTYDSIGSIREINYWIEGRNQWTRYFNEKGDLTHYDFIDYENDTSFQLTYIDRQLFKKAFYPPEDGNHQIKIYYPDNELKISDAELRFTVNFLNKPFANEKIILSSKKDLSIESIFSKKGYVKILSSTNQPLIFPLKIKANIPVSINIIVAPVSANYQMTDTLEIVTSDCKIPYKIYSTIDAYHIDGRTVQTLNSIQLSKTKDKYLILPGMGSQTDAIIVSKTGEKHHYRIDDITKIDLSTFQAGTYSLMISSCNTGGILKFIVTK